MLFRAAFEIVALAAGRLGELPLAAQSVIMTTDQSKYPHHLSPTTDAYQGVVLNTIPFGIGVAASTRVGNLLGLQSATGAKHAAHISALLSIIIGGIIMITLLVAKDVGIPLLCIVNLPQLNSDRFLDTCSVMIRTL